MNGEKGSFQWRRALRDDITAAFRHFPLSAAGVILLTLALACAVGEHLERPKFVTRPARFIEPACFWGYAFLAATIADAWKRGGPHYLWKIMLVIGLAVPAWLLTWHPPVPALHGARPITVPAMFLLLLTLSVLAQLRGKAAGPWLAHALAVCLGVGVLVPSIAAGLTVVGAPLLLIFALMGDSSGGGGADGGLFGLTLALWAFAVGGTVCSGLWSVLGRIGEFSPEAEQSRQERDDEPNRFLCFATVCCLFGEAWYAALVFFGEATATTRSAFHAVFWFAAFALLLLWCRTTARKLDRPIIGLLCGLLLAVLCAVCARVHQYGLTPNRYLAAAGLLWLLFAYGQAWFGRDCRPALRALVGLIVFSMWTPLGAAPMSVKSQHARRTALAPVPENLERINGISAFLERYTASSITVRVPHESAAGRILPVAGYDYMLYSPSSLWEGREESHAIGRIRIRRSGEKNVEIYLDGVLQVSVDLAELLVADIPRETQKRSYAHTLDGDKRWLKVRTDAMEVAFYMVEATVDWRIDALTRREGEKHTPRFWYSMILIGLRQGPAETDRADEEAEPDAAVLLVEEPERHARTPRPDRPPSDRISIEAGLPEKKITNRILPVSGYDYMLIPYHIDSDPTVYERDNISVARVDRFGKPDRFGHDFAISFDGALQCSTDLFAVLAAGIPWETQRRRYEYRLGEGKRRHAVRCGPMDAVFYIREAGIAWSFDAFAPKEERWRTSVPVVIFLTMRDKADKTPPP